MATPSSIPLAFTVRRCKPELVAPAKPTPHEQKLLSDIDDQKSLQVQFPAVQFYRYEPSMEGKYIAKVIKEALAQTLVFYYPFAGRLKEGANGNLIVDCNGEGVMFIKADADVTLEQFGEPLQPPFPCFEELLFDVPGSQAMLNCPLLLIQVTQLKCGGFIFALRFNHVMCDAFGFQQFMSTIGEMARVAVTPSISLVWERHLLNARDPPRVTFTHHEYDQVEATVIMDNMVECSFFFGPVEVSLPRSLLPLHLRHCTKFELIIACLWRCRTIAINLDPYEKVRMLCIANVRSKFNPPLPSGYYGNVLVSATAITTVKNLCHNPVGYAVELIKKAKANVTEEYIKSTADLFAIRGKSLYVPAAIGSYGISDLTHMGFENVDYGWGKAVFAGPANAIGLVSFFIPTKNKEGQVGTLVPICLPALAMERFSNELDNMLKHHHIEGKKSKSILISSAM
ncbi:hypothetical protein ERO13_A13G014400v2 [Gossypium hirsutum]|uniref:Benzyl alcohol O-benzoyltransferase n=1 Tax=Gossypium hirsutum TaxID=3635 RepID=A0A1U8KNL1_GOSHI|nr:benzyl alcohol O-benzoyltransferase-like [Gossypium hirsutum]KAG4164430.1 hypothetical protein ERO13_A13G014400v2 [Gossypium hirsutum]